MKKRKKRKIVEVETDEEERDVGYNNSSDNQQTLASSQNVGKRAKHDPETLEAAISAVRSKEMGLRQAAKRYGIPVTTLSNKVNGKTPLVYEPPKLLTNQEEDRLAKWLREMAAVAFGQTIGYIRAKVKAIIALRGGSTRIEDNLPSHAWVYRFFQRHPDLTLRTPMSFGKERALVTATTIDDWFKLVKQHLDSVDPDLLTDPSRLFNCDESGFSFDPKSRKPVWSTCATTANAQASYRASGIFPFNPERVLQSRKLRASAVFRSTPVDSADAPPVDSADAPPVDSADVPPVDSAAGPLEDEDEPSPPEPFYYLSSDLEDEIEDELMLMGLPPLEDASASELIPEESSSTGGTGKEDTTPGKEDTTPRKEDTTPSTSGTDFT
ncbi:tigger transposable element-derived protein 6-like protein [Elysia marginata]|uniref:Tigger transposable element-derived protein 6-like protein n=1 Tax=Elysia marginata TaxID=1093978 RepID=A0AAV4EFR2_9GAST|nr:tigger transposable element-derived protein 6-like protein [Elysia marginata]